MGVKEIENSFNIMFKKQTKKTFISMNAERNHLGYLYSAETLLAEPSISDDRLKQYLCI